MTERNDDITFSGSAARDASPATGDPSAIRAEIEDTRERLGDTLEQIGDRLNPHNIAAQVKGTVRDATVGRAQTAARTAADKVSEISEPAMVKVRDNPLPAVALAAGLGWLLAGGGRSVAKLGRKAGIGGGGAAAVPPRGYGTHANPLASRPAYAGSASGGGAGFAGSTGGGGSRSALGSPSAFAGSGSSGSSASEDRQAADELGSMGERSATSGTGAARSAGSIDDWHATSSAGAMASTGASGDAFDTGGESGRAARAKAAAGRLAESTRSAVGGAGSRVKAAGSTVAERTRSLPGGLVERLREKPVSVGVATIAVGLAAGYAVPATQREVELMGDARDQFVDRVRGTVQQARGKAKESAQEALQQTKAAAKQAVQGQK